MLVINCDDFGSLLCANLAVEGALRRGLARSATVMVPCPWAYDAIRRTLPHPQWSVGVHLTLTSEWERYRWRPLSGPGARLHDPDGFMWRTVEEVHAHASPDDALAECVRQVECAIAWGLRPTHLDTHMGVLEADGPWIAAYGEVARRFDLPVRLVDAARFAAHLPGVRILTRFAFRPPRTRADRSLLEVMTDFVRGLPPGVTETALHPCLASEELSIALPPAQAFRAEEAALLDAGAEPLASALSAAGVRTAGYRELMRA